MELNSPRTNPYNHVNQVKERLRDEGFTKKWIVISSEEAKLDGIKEHVNNLHIVKHKVFTDEDHKSQQKALYAISSKSGNKGYLEAIYGEKADKTTDAFLRNVDASLHVNNISS